MVAEVYWELCKICNIGLFVRIVNDQKLLTVNAKGQDVAVGIYLLKVNNRNIRRRCEIWSKLTIKSPKLQRWRRSYVFIVNFEHISHPIVNFEQVNELRSIGIIYLSLTHWGWITMEVWLGLGQQFSFCVSLSYMSLFQYFR